MGLELIQNMYKVSIRERKDNKMSQFDSKKLYINILKYNNDLFFKSIFLANFNRIDANLGRKIIHQKVADKFAWPSYTTEQLN